MSSNTWKKGLQTLDHRENKSDLGEKRNKAPYNHTSSLSTGYSTKGETQTESCSVAELERQILVLMYIRGGQCSYSLRGREQKDLF